MYARLVVYIGMSARINDSYSMIEQLTFSYRSVVPALFIPMIYREGKHLRRHFSDLIRFAAALNHREICNGTMIS